jgi:hypothetical protein
VAIEEGGDQRTGASPAGSGTSGSFAPVLAVGQARRGTGATWSARVRQLARAIRDSDEAAVQDAMVRMSRSRRFLAPVALAVGGVIMLFLGVKLLFTNWRLTLIQVLPALWIWAAIYDLKAHVLYGRSHRMLTGPVSILLVLAVAAVTAAGFFLNAVFGFAIAGPGPPPVIRRAFHEARAHLTVILAWGAAVGLCLGVAAIVVPRWGLWWFAISLSIVIGVMMVCYVAVPARLIGVKPTQSRRDKLAAAAVGGLIGAVVCTPGYILGRVGILMLGSSALFIPGIIVLAVGLTWEAGTTSAVKAVKMSAKFIAGRQPAADPPALAPAPQEGGGGPPG